MRINDLLQVNRESVHICSQFIAESNGLPLYRSLLIKGEHARRVKVRQRRTEGTISEVFNEAFKERSKNIYQRAIFATTEPDQVTESTEPFYVFPLNGYRFLYCKEVHKSNTGFQTAFDTIIEQFGDDGEQAAAEILQDLLTISYVDTNLNEGIFKGSEIIIYNTPSFIAVRCSSVGGYEEAIELISK